MGSIGENIKKLREERGLSMNQLAKMIGKSRSAVSQYEQGKVIPRMGAVEDMARVFGVDKMQILDDRADKRAASIADAIMASVELDELAALYRSMTDEGRAQLMIFARGLAATYPKNQVDSAIA